VPEEDLEREMNPGLELISSKVLLFLNSKATKKPGPEVNQQASR
jgi:hypothetical protein